VYLADSINRGTDVTTRRSLRSSSSTAVVVPVTRCSTIGDRAFPVAAARAWNSLPSFVTCYRRHCRLLSVIWRRTCSQHPTSDVHSSSPSFLFAEHVDFYCNYVTFPWSLLRLNATIIISVHIAHDDVVVSDAVLQSFNRVKIENAILLRAPLFLGSALDRAWNKRWDDLARAVGRLSAINSQDALILLKLSFSAPKVLHLLKCFPSVAHNSLAKFDDLLRCLIQLKTNSDLSDIQWTQASLPVKEGDLGVRRVSSLALPAFLASAASTLSLQVDILA